TAAPMRGCPIAWLCLSFSAACSLGPKTASDSSSDETAAVSSGHDEASSTGEDDGAGLSQTQNCAAYLTCISEVTPSELGRLLGDYGPEGSCWASTEQVADLCDEACLQGLEQCEALRPDTGGDETTSDTDSTRLPEV